VASPYGKDKKDFVADFSNIGPETDLAGPGVGIISTVPGGYAAWNGTSMATPAICGRIAALWGADGTLRAMPANAERSARAIEKTLSSGVLMGFGPDYEGSGRL
jgi:subtilisin